MAITKPTWPHSGVYSPRELRNKARRVDRHSLSVERVVRELRNGATLLLSFSPRQHWRLSTGAKWRLPLSICPTLLVLVTRCSLARPAKLIAI